MIFYPCILVCYCRFNTVFIFIVNLYRYQNVLKRIPANIVSLFWKIILMPNLWPSRSVLRWISVVRNHGVLSTFGLPWHVLYKFGVCMSGKNTVLFNLYSETSQIDCFCSVHKTLRWIGLILNLQMFKDQLFIIILRNDTIRIMIFFSLASNPIYIPFKNVSFSKRWKQARMWCQIWSCPEVFKEGHAFCDWPFLIWWF